MSYISSAWDCPVFQSLRCFENQGLASPRFRGEVLSEKSRREFGCRVLQIPQAVYTVCFLVEIASHIIHSLPCKIPSVKVKGKPRI